MTRTRMVSLFDWLEARWTGARMRRFVSGLLVGTYLLALATIELGRDGLLPRPLADVVPRSHFQAIELAFYLLLSYEVVGLVFGLAESVSNAAGKQLEIFSLILLRHAFEVFAHLDEPLTWPGLAPRVPEMLSDAAGALAIFLVLGFYYRLIRHRAAPGELRDRESFIAAKKLIALVLLVVFAAMGCRGAALTVLGRAGHHFFEPFYTLLIFADILVVLLSLRYSATYQVVFRNSGLAVATVLLRAALSAPPYLNAALGLAAALLALTLAAAYRAFGSPAAQAPEGAAAPSA